MQFSLYQRALVLICCTNICLLDAIRRAVTEHQLMHDRGRTIQSLKRLFWLSSAIEGLHTAQTRSAAFNPTKVLNLKVNAEVTASFKSNRVTEKFKKLS
uniref:Uncharacterized protein n=1 Tax=Pundamilia nyererei TaxID=303518 RepID=A0A3B4EWL1_9CICH